MLGAGYRSITFERRLIILYRIEQDVVTLIRALSAHRDLPGLTL